MTAERIAGIAVFGLVVAGVAIGFATIGPPQHVRLIELDHQRVNDLQSIENSVRDVDSLRRSQTVIAPPRSRLDWPRDPVTRQPYEYRRETATRYRLCATFGLPSAADPTDSVPARWRHGQGRACYHLDARAADEPN
jgi:hypothetical protein